MTILSAPSLFPVIENLKIINSKKFCQIVEITFKLDSNKSIPDGAFTYPFNRVDIDLHLPASDSYWWRSFFRYLFPPLVQYKIIKLMLFTLFTSSILYK